MLTQHRAEAIVEFFRRFAPPHGANPPELEARFRFEGKYRDADGNPDVVLLHRREGKLIHLPFMAIMTSMAQPVRRC